MLVAQGRFMPTRLQAFARVAAFAPLCVLSMPMACSSPRDPDGGPAPGDCPTALTCPFGGVTQLAADPNVTGNLAVTSTTLYWVAHGETLADSIQALSLDGGAPTVFYTAPDANTAIEALTVDDHDVYWTEVAVTSFGQYVSVIKAEPQASGSGGARDLVTNAFDPGWGFYGLAVDATYAYFGSLGRGVGRVPLAGGPVEVVRPGVAVLSLIASATGVYWIELDVPTSALRLMGLAPGAAAPVTVADVEDEGPMVAYGPLAATGSTVVWAGWDGSVRSVPVGGGSVQVLLGAPTDVAFVAADDSDVFVLEQTSRPHGSLEKLPVGGGQATPIATGMGVGGGDLPYRGVVTDATSVYWAGEIGLFKAAK
jgi:hypothetical protein